MCLLEAGSAPPAPSVLRLLVPAAQVRAARPPACCRAPAPCHRPGRHQCARSGVLGLGAVAAVEGAWRLAELQAARVARQRRHRVRSPQASEDCAAEGVPRGSCRLRWAEVTPASTSGAPAMRRLQGRAGPCVSTARRRRRRARWSAATATSWRRRRARRARRCGWARCRRASARRPPRPATSSPRSRARLRRWRPRCACWARRCGAGRHAQRAAPRRRRSRAAAARPPHAGAPRQATKVWHAERPGSRRSCCRPAARCRARRRGPFVGPALACRLLFACRVQRCPLPPRAAGQRLALRSDRMRC